MNRNEKIIKLLEDNGFKRQKDSFVKEVKITKSVYGSLSLGNIKIVAYCDFDEEDMEDTSVDFEINYDISHDLEDTEYIIDALSSCHEEMCELLYEIEDCSGDLEELEE